MGLCRAWLADDDMGDDGRISVIQQVLRNPKKLLAAIVESFGDGGEGGRWTWKSDTVRASFGGAIFQIWRQWQHTGQLPEAGGWYDQPLDVLAQIQAIETVYQTMRYKTSEGSKWETMTALQLDIVRELDG